ncbi:type II secretion system protein E (GspE) [Palleronia marisminoris]|uniref:Type II secretion system protein E n=1 Tax=Palleronia marisminoris TaxID=315423 RepID=A0A1Y5TBT4_9RHOB|nr:GspE/PulE family protein [Palleronia marisminoris]SFH20284.1 type II secretion system protein E (GspE) [Palleronia marisminoris]SLN56860.1 Type II secretion system protein E [Palleronia marisminoris]
MSTLEQHLAPTRDFDGFLSFLQVHGLLTPEAAKRARNARASTDHAADVVLIELGLTREVDLARHMAEYLSLSTTAVAADAIDRALLDSVGLAYLEANQVLPIELAGAAVVVAVADPFSANAAEAVGYCLDRPVELRVCTRSHILETLRTLRGDAGAAPELTDRPATAVVENEDFDDVERLRDVAREAPVIRFVNYIIQSAVDRGATDLHIEPRSDHVCIRMRCDGMLDLVETTSRSMLAGIATRIKILSQLNIAERRLPQDGRMRVAVRGQEIDLRVSVLPSVHGESFVLRILDRSGVTLSLEALGYAPDAIGHLRALAQTPNGIILVTGPTGSGKTTTLYSILRERQSEQVKIFTVEDPVEYRLDGITQLQVDPSIDLTFARALRSVLRHDPDVILVGEIRDRETAQIAIQAALTGHLVFSTLHTNSASGALARLTDMGVDSYLIGATIRAVIAQRLLRKTCLSCRGAGCDLCHDTGYSGRTVTYEILDVTRETAGAINAGAAESEVLDRSVAQGFVRMVDHAAGLTAAGITTPAEVRRVLDQVRESLDARD